MRLSKLAILALRGSTKEFKNELAAALNTSDKSLYRWMDDNRVNGPLTATAAIKMMVKEFSMPAENDDLLIEDEQIQEVPFEDDTTGKEEWIETADKL